MDGAAQASELSRVVLASPDDFEGWRKAARSLACQGVQPSRIVWTVTGSQVDLFGTEEPAGVTPPFPVPKYFLDLAETCICHSDPERFALLYAMLWKLRCEGGAMDDRTDPLTVRLEGLARAVRRDAHKMHAFVRFREVAGPDGQDTYVAWFEPEHHIVRRESGFFVRRFFGLRWSILTPSLSVHWDGEQLLESAGTTRSDAPGSDALEETWKTYYASVFNPSRLKVDAMTREMPKKYWKNLPESALIQPLIETARSRELEMLDRGQAGDRATPVKSAGDAQLDWNLARDEASHCHRCALHQCASRTVFGEGPIDARLFLVGEQPGDQEDLAGRPFIGPAGQLLERALVAAGIDRTRAYVTNAVKHFKFVQRGKRRIHARPEAGEIAACRWWLDRERALVRPALTVALGGTAVRALTGNIATISSMRGKPIFLADGSECWVTVHPSYILRMADADRKEEEYFAFVEDLKRIRARARQLTD